MLPDLLSATARMCWGILAHPGRTLVPGRPCPNRPPAQAVARAAPAGRRPRLQPLAYGPEATGRPGGPGARYARRPGPRCSWRAVGPSTGSRGVLAVVPHHQVIAGGDMVG